MNKYEGNNSLKYKTVFCLLGGSWLPSSVALLPWRLGQKAETYSSRERDRYVIRPDLSKSKTGSPLQCWQE